MTTLIELLERLSSEDPASAVYASTPWAADSEAVLLVEGESNPPPGHQYLLEVSLAQEALETWASWRSGREPSPDEAVAAVLYYAEHDAYQPVE